MVWVPLSREGISLEHAHDPTVSLCSRIRLSELESVTGGKTGVTGQSARSAIAMELAESLGR